MSDVEQRIRDTLTRRADAVTPSPDAWPDLQARLSGRRHSTWWPAAGAAAIVAVILLATVVGIDKLTGKAGIGPAGKPEASKSVSVTPVVADPRCAGPQTSSVSVTGNSYQISGLHAAKPVLCLSSGPYTYALTLDRSKVIAGAVVLRLPTLRSSGPVQVLLAAIQSPDPRLTVNTSLAGSDTPGGDEVTLTPLGAWRVIVQSVETSARLNVQAVSGQGTPIDSRIAEVTTLAAPGSPDADKAYITGTFGSSGGPAPGRYYIDTGMVSAYRTSNFSGQPVASAATDKHGNYRLTVPPGTYYLRGYTPNFMVNNTEGACVGDAPVQAVYGSTTSEVTCQMR